MKDKQLKLIYEYMESAGWVVDSKYLDSNSAWEVVQELVRKGDWEKSKDCFWSEFKMSKERDYFFWLLNPTNFFNCFTKWLEEKENQKGGTVKAPDLTPFQGTKNDLSI